MKILASATFAMLFATPLAFADDSVPSRIAWYGTLDSGLAEAKRSGRLILLVSGAPHCLGVSGVW